MNLPSMRATMVAAAMLSVAALGAQPGKLDPRTMPRIGQVDERFQSYNVEMVEVTGGRFWAPYKTTAASERQVEKPSVQGLDPNMFRMRPPIDLGSPRLRVLAAALGPAYMRVSGTWANSTYFHDADEPAPAAPPPGFGGVLTRPQWRGVMEFANAADAKVVTSFAISAGVVTRPGHGRPPKRRSS
jgi:heparanase